MLQELPEGAEVVIRTQVGYERFGDVSSDFEMAEQEIKEDNEIYIIDFCNEGYSPEQALGK